MPNNKERLDDLKAGLELVQESLRSVREELRKSIIDTESRLKTMETSFGRMLEETMNQMRELIVTSRESGSSTANGNRRVEDQQSPMGHGQDNPFAMAPTQGHSCQMNLEMTRYNGGYPEEWLNRAKQYFDYYDTPRDQWVSFALYYLTEEANAWWQAKQRGRGFVECCGKHLKQSCGPCLDQLMEKILKKLFVTFEREPYWNIRENSKGCRTRLIGLRRRWRSIYGRITHLHI
ncbi:unnamed protein product [Arabidopsis thaliana]|uniref:Retrotransposon gag domain-containing protein n=1 Tax=Arabidopsis thaliana TaxID=3702 RepID=A0A654EHA9_ARATH|nr:unnamed protein product [Arabidopsis thaliana]